MSYCNLPPWTMPCPHLKTCPNFNAEDGRTYGCIYRNMLDTYPGAIIDGIHYENFKDWKEKNV
jgi:hypothetical protein